MLRQFVFAISLLLPVIASAEAITGPVSHYRDGDTFLIRNQPIRLCGIDAPERGTSAGKRATAYLKQVTKGKALKCIPVSEGTVCDGRSKRTNRDRLVAQCFMQGRDIAGMLVRAGHACDWPSSVVVPIGSLEDVVGSFHATTKKAADGLCYNWIC